ncbi:ParB-like protein [Idiomarina xiamenensis]|uniref:inorganic diphosphatase n=1 Tax=Idiomarina xiamenensis 10-D-4 TaxID=740709 RepID=K2KE01_9GAMM|nr:ParB-like protein [Idiomarina xiamenensis]EKE80939.1 inorganic pyrophosphatase [Idiomarina xiamenensis 10-D-4]
MRRCFAGLFVILASWSSVIMAQEVTLTIAKLHPTQAVLAYDQVTKKIDKYQHQQKAFNKDLNELPRKTVVLGPAGQYYLTDGHHTFSAMREFSPLRAEQPVTVRVTADKSDLSQTEFWQWLVANDQVWLRDGRGQLVEIDDMPRQVGREFMADDPLRGAMYWLRDRYLRKPEKAIPFVEFYWAQYVREHAQWAQPQQRGVLADLRWLQRIGEFIQQLPAETVIGPDGETAVEMGQIAAQAHRQALIETPAYNSEEGLLTAVVEIPAGSVDKWQLDHDDNDWLSWELQNEQPRKIAYLSYPINYGALPNTLAARADGGDGDPLDVLILGPALPRGSQLSVRIIGRLQMTDNGERDDKYIAVVPSDTVFSELQSVSELQQRWPGITAILQTWFSHYKGAEGQVSGLHFDDQGVDVD